MDWRDRLQRIEAIVEKDLKVTKWWWIVAIIISATEFVAMTSVASNVRRMNDLYTTPFTGYAGTLRSLYAVSAFLTSMVLGLAFSYVHGGEIRRGTIRSIILYPVDMNDVTIAKLASSFVLATGCSTILFLGFTMPFFVYGVWPVGDFLAIHAMALLMAFVALATGVFLAHVVAHVVGRMIVSPSLLGSAFLLASILLTETAANVIGLQFVAAVGGPPRAPPPEGLAGARGGPGGGGEARKTGPAPPPRGPRSPDRRSWPRWSHSARSVSTRRSRSGRRYRR